MLAYLEERQLQMGLLGHKECAIHILIETAKLPHNCNNVLTTRYENTHFLIPFPITAFS